MTKNKPSDNKTTASGVFERAENGGGSIRNPGTGYKITPKDPVIPRSTARQFNLRGGEHLVGSVQKNREGPGFAVNTLTEIDGGPVSERESPREFDELVAINPDRPLKFSTIGGPIEMRVVDLMTPIGFGQRGLIVAPPRTGKTILLHQMAKGVLANHPQAHLIVLLVDERPEEVTEFRRGVEAELAASSNDQDYASHMRLSRLVIARAKRLVEGGRDVVILMDSLTRLGRAFNSSTRGVGRTMSGGLDAAALTIPKSIFGAARNVEGGGSLTIVATALIDTGSRMDEVIFNEFKGTGNMEIVLSRELANRRIWPAIDLNQSGTRREEMLLSPEILKVSHAVRRMLQPKEPERGMQMLLEALARSPDNETLARASTDRSFR